MLKKRLTIIALILVFVVSIAMPIVKAENEINDDPEANKHTDATVETTQTTEGENKAETNTENETVVGENTSTNSQNNSEDTLKKGDVYLVGDNITIDYVIDGNLFVMAKSVTINSQIGGDVFAMARTINIGEQGYIFSNLFAMAQDINVNGVVYDVYSMSEKMNVEGYVYRDIRSLCSELSISGAIGRNAFVTFQNVKFGKEQIGENGEKSLTAQAKISGDFNYASAKEIQIPEGVVSGKTNFEQVDTENAKNITIVEMLKEKISELVRLIVTSAIILLVLLWLAPKIIKDVSELLTKKTLPTLGIGILTPIVLSAVAIVLLLIGVTVKLAFITMFVLATLLMICKSIFVISTNTIICEKYNIEKNSATFGILALVCLVLWVIGLIPIIGGIVNAVVAILGLGIISSLAINAIKNKKQK